MIETDDRTYIFVPRTASTSLEKAIMESNPTAINTSLDHPPFRNHSYLSANPDKRKVAVIREPTDWLLSMYNSHFGQGSKFRKELPRLDNRTGILTHKDILELWCFIAKRYLHPNECITQMDWIGDSEVILFEHLPTEFNRMEHLNSSTRKVNYLTPDAEILARIIWKVDYQKYNEKKNGG